MKKNCFGKDISTFLKYMKTKAWVSAVKNISGYKDPLDLSDNIPLNDNGGGEESWKKYIYSERSPDNSSDRLDKVEKELEGTKDVFIYGVEGSSLWTSLENEFNPIKVDMLFSLSFNWPDSVLHEGKKNFSEHVSDIYSNDFETDLILDLTWGALSLPSRYNVYLHNNDIYKQSKRKTRSLAGNVFIPELSDCLGLTNLCRNNASDLPSINNWHLLTRDIIIYRKLVHKEKFIHQQRLTRIGWEYEENKFLKEIEKLNSISSIIYNVFNQPPFKWDHDKYPNDIYYDPSCPSDINISKARVNIEQQLSSMEADLDTYGLRKQDFIHVLKHIDNNLTTDTTFKGRTKKYRQWMNNNELHKVLKKDQKSDKELNRIIQNLEENDKTISGYNLFPDD